jgi:hypothetical protein
VVFEQSNPFAGPNPFAAETASGEPLMYYQSQPYSKASAATALADFDKNPDQVKLALGGDAAARQLRAALREMSLGRSPPDMTPAMPADGAGVQEQMQSREELINEARLDTFARHMRMDNVQRAQQKRFLATQEQHDFAVAEKARLLADPGFGAKVLAKDADATDRWIRVCQAAAAQVAPKNYDWAADTI